MADPYADRDREQRPQAEAPATDSSLGGLVEARGGLAASSCAKLAMPAAATFVAVLVRDDGLVPPLARLRPEQAVMMLAASAADAAELAPALARARAATGQILMLKEGLVAGPAGRPGAHAVELSASETLLAAALAESVGWETDPDFGYEVAAEVDDLVGEAARALCPRLLYADHDRAYEHADLVVAYKRQRRRRLDGLGVTDPELLAATGWPIEPTGESWKR
jgi:hypothetical protein